MSVVVVQKVLFKNPTGALSPLELVYHSLSFSTTAACRELIRAGFKQEDKVAAANSGCINLNAVGLGSTLESTTMNLLDVPELLFRSGMRPLSPQINFSGDNDGEVTVMLISHP